MERLNPCVLWLLSTVPSAPPSHVHLQMVNDSALKAYWRDVPLIDQNGVILGYRLLLQQEDGGPVVWNVTVEPDVRWYMFTNLEIFQTYSTQILAFTIKGEGPLSANVSQKTDGSGRWKTQYTYRNFFV